MNKIRIGLVSFLVYLTLLNLLVLSERNVEGMPVLLEMELFKPEIPVSLLTEKDIPFFLPNPNIT